MASTAIWHLTSSPCPQAIATALAKKPTIMFAYMDDMSVTFLVLISILPCLLVVDVDVQPLH